MRRQLLEELEELSQSVPESKMGNDWVFGEPKEAMYFFHYCVLQFQVFRGNCGNGVVQK